MRKSAIDTCLTKITQGLLGLLLSLGILVALFAFNKHTLLAQLSLYETMPQYRLDSHLMLALGFDTGGERSAALFAANGSTSDMPDSFPGDIDEAPASHIETALIGLNDVVYQTESKEPPAFGHLPHDNLTIGDVEVLRDLAQLKKLFYTVDRRTDITREQFDIDRFLAADLTIDNHAEGPKILIFHTHSNERYADSRDISQGVLAVGAQLKQTLEQTYGIETIHVTDSFDIIDGKSHIIGAYERMEPAVKKILAENPSIQIAIDLHRDGVDESRRLVADVNGKPTAQIMFFNGLSKLYNRDGTLEDIRSLPNAHIDTNLALSFHMQLAANDLYPGFARKVYLNAYRYSLHMLPKSLLIEVGAQTNTLEEALNAVEPLAAILARVIINPN